MQIKFCGAARMVTGSSHLITLKNGYKILLDCGLFQGEGKDNWDLNNKFYFDPADIDMMVLSHAHIDHSGRLPKLVKDGFKGNIYTTHATRSLSSIMLLDSAKIQEYDTKWYNEKIADKKKGKKEREALYTPNDVAPALSRFKCFPYHEWIHVNDNVSIYLTDAGHILGSATVTLKLNDDGEEKIVGFTADIGRPERPILRDPVPMPACDYLICESTYGDKSHGGIPEQSDQLLQIINETCIENKGKLIIPAFSVGRTQEIVYMLDKIESAGKFPKIPVYVDSPLAVNATTIYGSHPECFDDQLHQYLLTDDNPFGFNQLKYIKKVEDSKKLNTSKAPCIIISSAGMMQAGRVQHHLYNHIENPSTTILIVGYCSPYTPGGRLRAGDKEVKIFRDIKKVNARIALMDSFSAHADQQEMIEFISNQKDTLKQLYLVHGDYDVQKAFKYELVGAGFKNVLIPAISNEVYI